MPAAAEIVSSNAYLIIAVLLTVLNLVAYLAMGLFVWIAKSAIRDLRDLQKSHNDLRLELPVHYVRDAHFRGELTKVLEKLDKIFDRFDSKADKHG